MQPLKYILSHEPQENAKIFAQLKWAAYLKEWPGPSPGERPAAYLIILGDTQISKGFGSTTASRRRASCSAREKGLAGCMIGLIKREELRETLAIPPRYEILLVIALGKPREQVVIDEVGPDGDIKYWRDRDAVHHVPKRSLKEIIIA